MHDDTNLLELEDVTPQHDVPAGAFSAWLDATLNAARTGRGADVPCGGCTACCSGSYFIHISPQESETLGVIPKALLFPAPGWPSGHVVMGFDEHGRCPMLKEGVCSIYTKRPATCRAFDCRVFAATGIDAGGDERRRLNARSRRWQFDYPAEHDRAAQAAVRAAAAFLEAHIDCFAEGRVPRNPTQRALTAIKVFEVFLDRPDASDHVEATVAAIVHKLDAIESSESRNARPS